MKLPWRNGVRPDFFIISHKFSFDFLIIYDDFAKYAKRIPATRLRETLGSVTRQDGGKYIYTQTGPMINIAQAKDALNILEMAGLIYKVYHSPGHGLPPGAHANMKIFKVLLHDTGIFHKMTKSVLYLTCGFKPDRRKLSDYEN